ncbi:TlpA family protein disulfide reductase [Caldimonas brevitalea]|uniref:Thioredoxin family protein n=1 Tax=Caldimonas brevitalea TaxID=413882 RepID=A0A0G3BP94_9BURK|nr:TlpA disulfide reductase family protein [Caldimonas brevitalea]AKJ28375.1 thioredoxin family protein [Caldimonas brevitalea]
MPPSRRQFSAALGLAAVGLTAGVPGPASAQVQVRPWPADRPTPPLALRDLQGRTVALAPFRGKVMVLNFWASWCEPCVAEMPSLLRLAERGAAQGLAVLAVNYQEGDAKIRSFLDTVLGEVPDALPVLLDRDGAAARAWTPRVFPSTVLIDRNGRPHTTVVGELDWTGAKADTLLAPLLAAAPR